MCLMLTLSGSPRLNLYVMRSEPRLHLHLRRRRRWSQPLGANSSQMKAAMLREWQTADQSGLLPHEPHCHQYLDILSPSSVDSEAEGRRYPT
jgi:hypothetical protein